MFELDAPSEGSKRKNNTELSLSDEFLINGKKKILKKGELVKKAEENLNKIAKESKYFLNAIYPTEDLYRYTEEEIKEVRTRARNVFVAHGQGNHIFRIKLRFKEGKLNLFIPGRGINTVFTDMSLETRKKVERVLKTLSSRKEAIEFLIETGFIDLEKIPLSYPDPD